MKKIYIVFVLLICFLIQGNQQLVQASFTSSNALGDTAVQFSGDAAFDTNGNVFVAASKAQSLPLTTSYLFNTATETEGNSPLFLGDISLSTPDGSGGFYVYGTFKYSEGHTGSTTNGITTGSDETLSIAHISSTGVVTSVQSINTEGVSSMVYAADKNALFLTGTFNTVNGQPHNALACIDPATGDFCVIDAYDWATNQGFDTATSGQITVSYDGDKHKVLIGGGDAKYASTDDVAMVTVLDVANPVANELLDYFPSTDIFLFQNYHPSWITHQLFYVNTGTDMDDNGTTEKLLYYYSGPKIWTFIDNGAGFATNTEISTLGFKNPILTLKPGTQSIIALGTIDYTDKMTYWDINLQYTNLLGGVFSFSLSGSPAKYDIIDPQGSNTVLTNVMIDANGDSYYSGNFSYVYNDVTYHNFLGLNAAGVPIATGDIMNPASVTTMSASGDSLFIGGNLNFARAGNVTHSILKINGATGAIDPSFDVALLNADGVTTDVSDGTRFLVARNYLYVYKTPDTIVSVRNNVSQTTKTVPKSNLFRINLSTGDLDTTYTPEINEGIDTMEMDSTGAVYAASRNDIYALNTDGTIRQSWQDNLTASSITLNDIRKIVAGDDGHLYIIQDGAIYRGNGIGEFTTMYTDVDFTGARAAYQSGSTLIVAYRPGADVLFKVFHIAPDGTATIDTSNDLNDIYLTYSSGTSEVRSLVSQDGSLYIVGRFDMLRNTVTLGNVPSNGFSKLELSSGTAEHQHVLTTTYGLDTTIPIGAAVDTTHFRFALFGPYSLQLYGDTPSISFSNFGLQLFATETETPATTPTPTPTGGGIVSINDSVVSGTVIINNGDATTTSNHVILTISATNATSMALSDSPDFSHASYIPYQSSIPFTLQGASGEKTVYVHLRGTTNSIFVSDSITLTGGSSAPASPTSTPSQEACTPFTKTLTLGARGSAVTAAQKILVKLGYLDTTVFGNFGALTKKAVIAFQNANHISPLGIIGPLTRAKLLELGCK